MKKNEKKYLPLISLMYFCFQFYRSQHENTRVKDEQIKREKDSHDILNFSGHFDAKINNKN